MDILQGVAHTLCFINDVLITGSLEEAHLKNLEEVLRKLQAHGVQLKMLIYEKVCGVFM